MGRLFEDVSNPPKAPERDYGILSLGRQLYDQDKQFRELIIYCSDGDILRYNAYQKSSVEKVLTLLEFTRERQRREKEMLDKHGKNTDRVHRKH